MKSLRVLIVEDHTDTREVLVMLLETFGHVSTQAAGVEEVTGRIKAGEQFDVVLSDTRLVNSRTGNVDMGWDVVYLYHQHNIPFIGMSAQEVGAEWKKRGAMAFLRKPASGEQIASALSLVSQNR